MATSKKDEQVHGYVRLLADVRSVEWSRGAEGLKNLGASAAEALVEILRNDADPVMRRCAATAMFMNSLADKRVAKALIEALSDPEPAVRVAAANALSRVGPASDTEIPDAAIDVAIANLLEAPRGKRYGPADTLNGLAVVVKSRAAGAIPVLIDTLGVSDAETRSLAIASLHHIGPHAHVAAEPLIEILRSAKAAYLRRAAAWALASIEAAPALAVPALIESLSEKNAEIRAMAVESLGKFGRHARAALPRLEELRTDKKAVVREAVAKAIEAIR